MLMQVEDRRAKTDWTLATITEHLLSVRTANTAAEAIRRTIETAAESLDAEIAVVMRAGRVVDSIGLRNIDTYAKQLWRATENRFANVRLRGLGACVTLTVHVEGHPDLRLLVARKGKVAFPPNEAALTHGFGSALGLMLNLLDRFAAERNLRRQSEALLEITNAIARRFPHDSIYRLITQHAKNLLRTDAIIMRASQDINESNSDSNRNDRKNDRVASVICSDGLTFDAVRRLSGVAGLGGLAIGAVQTVEQYDKKLRWFEEYLPGAAGGIAAPIFVGGIPLGSLGAVSTETGRRFTSDEIALLQVLAELSSIVLTDARAVQAVRDARHDPLTGLPSRGLILERLGSVLAAPNRLPIAVLFLDIDGFKPINDHYGHEVGDQVLRTLSGRMTAAMIGRGEIGRIGGDEFVAFVYGATAVEEDLQDCVDREVGVDAKCADDLIKEICRPIAVTVGEETIELNIGASIGIAVENGESAVADLVRRADAAMYRANATGGNQWWRLT